MRTSERRRRAAGGAEGGTGSGRAEPGRGRQRAHGRPAPHSSHLTPAGGKPPRPQRGCGAGSGAAVRRCRRDAPRAQRWYRAAWGLGA